MKNETRMWVHNCPEEGMIETVVGESCSWCDTTEQNSVHELRRRAKVRDEAMKEAKDFVSKNTHFNSAQTIAAFAVAEYICRHQNVSLYEP